MARERLGLTQRQLAGVMDLPERTMRQVEAPETAATHRPAPVRFVRLLQAYLDGHRPADWPGDG